MRLSLWTGPHQRWADARDAAVHADATGWDGVYVADHFMGNGAPDTPTLEATAVLAAFARDTTRVRLGSLVFGNTYRHPAVLANWAATVDHLSGGRLLLGVGAGWQENEHEAYGIELPPPGPRVARFEEACQVLLGLLRSPSATLHGEHYRLDDARCEPKPANPHLPLLIGAKGRRMLGVAARYADEWNMWSTPASLAEHRAVLDAACERAGRDPASIATSTQALVLVTDDEAAARTFVEGVAPRAAVAGPPHRFAERCEEWVEAGADEVIVPDFTLGLGSARTDALDALREAVAPLRT
jgi:F420-dependent oxidoreductase-like protein